MAWLGMGMVRVKIGLIRFDTYVHPELHDVCVSSKNIQFFSVLCCQLHLIQQHMFCFHSSSSDYILKKVETRARQVCHQSF